MSRLERGMRAAPMRALALAISTGLAWAGPAVAAADLPPSYQALPTGLPADGAGIFFDDFDYADVAGLTAQGWVVRTAGGHPGVPGARWGAEALSLAAAPAPGMPGNRVLRLTAHTDGTGAGTLQAQVCHQRKLLAGSYAARVRFSDAPLAGAAGDPVIQSFYTSAPLAHDYDPNFSEVDWEYLPQGGWGSPQPRLYGLSWQTVRLEPWDARNAPTEVKRPLGGWHVLAMQVAAGRVRMFLDGELVAEPGGRNVPVAPMALAFNLWFAPGDTRPADGPARVWTEDIDWVVHVRDRVLAPAELEAAVQAWRAGGRTRIDTVPASQPALPSRCDI